MDPAAAFRAAGHGALLIDIRGDVDRDRNGIVPGSLHVPRTVLEWRLEPDGAWRNPHVGGLDQHVLLLCDHGCSSIFAAAVLVDLGYARAGDVVGGFATWAAAGLPTAPSPQHRRRPASPPACDRRIHERSSESKATLVDGPGDRPLRYLCREPDAFAGGMQAMELDQTHVWITTRRLSQGAREQFSHAWRPSEFPEGMLRAYECYSSDGTEVVGISIWDSPESRERFRLSEVESKRREAMAPFVIEERSGFYFGRELKIPERS